LGRYTRQLEPPILDALGNIGDLVGGVGVIVTLAYLAVQVRQNTRSVRSAAYQAVAGQSIDVASSWATEPSFAPIHTKAALDLSSLDESERFRYDRFAYSNFRSFENLFYQYRQGVVEPDLWVGFRQLLVDLLTEPGLAVWWQERRGYFSEDFQDYAETLRASNSPAV
jgi:hypothetical protein